MGCVSLPAGQNDPSQSLRRLRALFPRLCVSVMCVVWVGLCLVGLFIELATVSAAEGKDAAAAAEHALARGAAAFRQGDFAEAAAAWQLVLQHYGTADSEAARSRVLTRLARAYQAMGLSRKALEHLVEARQLAAESGDRWQTAVISGELGAIYSAAGEIETAQRYLQESLNMARGFDDSGLAASILNNLGNLLGSRGDDLDAVQRYEESASLAQASNDWALAGRARVNAALAAVRLTHYAKARVALGQGLMLLRRAAPSHDQAYDLINIGLTYRELRQPMAADLRDQLALDAAAAFSAAIDVAKRLDDALALSYASGYLGGLYEEERRYHEALRLTRQALRAAQRVKAPESTYRWEWQTGRLLRAQNQLDAALQAYRRAAATLQSFRQELRVKTPRTPSFRVVAGPVYFELVDLLFQKAAEQSDALTTAPLLLEARETVELFKAAELQDYFQDDCVDAARQVKTRLDRISQTAIVIYPILLPDRLELLVSLPTGLKQVTVPVGRATLTREVRAFRQALEKRTTHQYRPYARRLYDWLIRPLKADLEAAEAKINARPQCLRNGCGRRPRRLGPRWGGD